MKKRFASLLLTAFIIACASSLLPREPAPTLAVINYGIDPFALYVDEHRVGSSLPGAGRVECIKLSNLPTATPHSLFIKILGSNSRIPAPPVNFFSQPGWMLTIGFSPAIEVYSLQPAAPCGASK